ncbi:MULTISPECIES: Fur family transcriptional regulator [Gammaproteobacteria]|uniref:Fur family transcriptional regulator n=1 Tax=Gammaproteobacteria TaxID=1236 RepID=UPI001AD9CA90|nr:MULTISPECIES: Fur family transcriptional regulator [Gammaproteobacteria]MBO9480416.1 transcriptional repressor [Salinisphaera sp. G21_0]MBO9493659.1 transcriptional repressor [Thalassotalea sp. G20_0]
MSCLNPYRDHNHQHCIKDALNKARLLCRSRNIRLTPLRERVLELVWQSHCPVGAYEILAELTQGESKPAQPPTVYRALDFLREQGLVHRLSSINAYIGCCHPSTPHNSCFLICTQCRTTIEIEHPAIEHSLEDCASEHGFIIADTSIELAGLCTNCKTK